MTNTVDQAKRTGKFSILKSLRSGRTLGLITLSVVLGLAVTGTSDAVWSYTWGSGWNDRAEVRFVRVFTNDDGRVDSRSRDPADDGTDPGYDKPVAVCRAWKKDSYTVGVKIQNAYPSYTCQAWVKIRNTGEKPVRSTIFEIDAPPYLTVLRQGSDSSLVLWPGEWTYQSFTVHVEQEADENGRYDLAISYTFVRKYYKSCAWKT
jgi:hypothetical protein